MTQYQTKFFEAKTAYITYEDEEGKTYSWKIDSRLADKVYDKLVREGYRNIITRI